MQTELNTTVIGPLRILTQNDRDIPLVLLAFLIWKFWKKTKIVSLSKIPLEEAFRQARDFVDDEPPTKTKGAARFVSWIWD